MRHARTTWRGTVVAASVAATVAATLSTAAAGPTPASTSPPAGRTAARAQDSLLDLSGVTPGRKVVTLVTGDRVTLDDTGHGYTFSTTAAPRPDGIRPTFAGTAGPGHFYVYPSDVEPAVQAGRVDRGLFDVKYLAEHGYTDDQATSVPLIVQYPSARPAASVTAAAQALPASTATRGLPSIHGAALTVPKGHADAFWSAVHGTGTGSGAGAAALGAGLTRIWLDRKVHVTLDQSVPLIGAPTAWAAGYDGTGVKVAILDTGIDATHPDLAGRVDQSRSFVPGVDSAKDGHGHGTHVASIITGSGAASGGRYRGVAPGVKLEIGKVLNDAGSGEDSWIIAGMDWAAHSGAKVVSMSLGGEPTDGTDPLSQAVDDLTAQTGTLFVIAAGNFGPTRETVATPGAASAALTVAAVDKSDALADFSSRGPRPDGAMKPDIAAPGVHIVAARAAGTSLGTGSLPGDGPVDGLYTSASGTSMATPHVAGSAAILAQKHPEWAGPQLKAALMSTARDDGYSVYEQGAGRVDIGRASTQKVLGLTPNLDFGRIEQDASPTSREVTYANAGDTPVTLTLTPAIRDAGGHAATGVLGGDRSVTVPARGTATATVTMDPTGLAEGTYTGAVTATDATTGTRLTVPVGVVREPPKVTLTVHTLDRAGSPVDARLFSVIDVTGDQGALRVPVTRVSAGVLRMRVARSTYSISAMLGFLDDLSRPNLGWLLDPEVAVGGDTDVTLDGRELREFRFTTPQPTETSPSSGSLAMRFERTLANGTIYGGYSDAGNYVHISVTPTAPVTTGRFELGYEEVRAAPEVTMRTNGAHPIALHPIVFPHDGRVQFGGLGVEQVPFTGRRTGEVVDVGDATNLTGLDLRGRLALFGSPDCDVPVGVAHALRDAGAAGILAFPTGGCFPLQVPIRGAGTAADPSPDLGIPYVSLPPVEARALLRRLAHEPIRITVTGDPESPSRQIYLTHVLERGRVPVPNYVLDGHTMSRIDVDYHSSRPARLALYSQAYTTTPELLNRANVAPPLTAPAHRVEYVGPVQPDVIFKRDLSNRTDGTASQRDDRFEHPVRLHQAWGTPASLGAETIRDEHSMAWYPATGPAPTFGLCTICRQDGVLYADYTHSAGRAFDGTFVGPTLTHLYRDGEEVPFDDARFGFPLPGGTAAYRLTVEDPPTRTSAEWTFRSSPVTSDTIPPTYQCLGTVIDNSTAPCRAEPVVFVDYDFVGSLALDNTAAAGTVQRFRVDAYHSPSTAAMPRITGVDVWVSTDDGRHWAPARVERDGDGSVTATARYPEYDRTTGAVSLRVRARDAAGDTVTQTTMRAFDLRDPRAHTPTGAR